MGDGLDIALHAGIVVEHDAVSRSLLNKLTVVDQLADLGFPVRATAFTGGTNVDHPALQVVRDLPDLVTRAAFRRAAVHVFEFGIFYPAFDAVFLLSDVATAAVYHNLTPIELVDDDTVRRALGRSLVQRHNLAAVDEVVCASAWSRDELIGLGHDPARLSVLALPPGQPAPLTPPDRPRRPPGAPLELLAVGRLVRSKGILDVLAAVARVASTGVDVSLTLVANSSLSSPDVVAAIEGTARRSGGPHVTVRRDVTDEELVARYRSADALVVASYHEGYCVPVVEAFAQGCPIVAYDSSNLPDVTGGLADLVPTGDVDALAAALGRLAKRVSDSHRDARPPDVATRDTVLTHAEWRDRVVRHLADHSWAAFAAGFSALLGRAATRTGQRWESPSIEEAAWALAGASR